DRGAVDFDEWTGGAVGVLVNGAGDEIFSDAAFAAEKDSGICGCDALDQCEDGLHFFAAGDDVVVMIALAEGLAQVAIFFAQVVGIELLADYQDQFSKRERLQDVVAGADFYGFDGGFNGAVGGHDDYRDGGVGAFHGLQEFQAGHAGEFEVGDYQVEVVFLEKLQAGFGVGGGGGAVTFVGELEFEKTAQFGFVFDD